MAEVGIKIWNDGGVVQIDSNYRNIAHLNIIRVTTIPSVGWVEIPLEDDKWYVFEPNAMASNVEHPFLVSYTKPGGIVTKTYRVFAPCKIHVFGFIPSNAVSTNYGLRLYDPKGNISFDSSFSPFRVMDHIVEDMTNAQMNSSQEFLIHQKTYGKRVGFCISRGIQLTGWVNGTAHQRCLMFHCSGSGFLRIKFKTFYTTGGYGDTTASTGTLSSTAVMRYDFCIVDCSGLPV